MYLLLVKLSALSLGLFAVPSMAAGWNCFTVFELDRATFLKYYNSAQSWATSNCQMNKGYTYDPTTLICHVPFAGPIPAVMNKAYSPLFSAPPLPNIQAKVTYQCQAPGDKNNGKKPPGNKPPGKGN